MDVTLGQLNKTRNCMLSKKGTKNVWKFTIQHKYLILRNRREEQLVEKLVIVLVKLIRFLFVEYIQSMIVCI